MKKILSYFRFLKESISRRGFLFSIKLIFWELSFDRADSARKYLLINNISSERIHSVIARADTDLADQNNPYSALNRRITIMLLRNSAIENYKISAPISAPVN